MRRTFNIELKQTQTKSGFKGISMAQVCLNVYVNICHGCLFIYEYAYDRKLKYTLFMFMYLCLYIGSASRVSCRLYTWLAVDTGCVIIALGKPARAFELRHKYAQTCFYVHVYIYIYIYITYAPCMCACSR